MSLTAAQISALHQAANQIDTHNGTVRSITAQMASLPILPDYTTSAGYIVQDMIQNVLIPKMTRLSALLDMQATGHRTTAGAFQNNQDAGAAEANALNAVAAQLQAL